MILNANSSSAIYANLRAEFQKGAEEAKLLAKDMIDASSADLPARHDMTGAEGAGIGTASCHHDGGNGEFLVKGAVLGFRIGFRMDEIPGGHPQGIQVFRKDGRT